jgi:Holliday junction resolvasome RuvABC endonuclease subunit
MTRILALDPSVQNLGWAIVETDAQGILLQSVRQADFSGVWHPSARKGSEARETQLASFLSLQIDNLRPSVVVVEIPNTGKHRPQRYSDTTTYARAVGACEAVPVCRGYPVVRVTPSEWKRNAGKSRTRRLVASVAGKSVGSDETDAIGIGMWYATKLRIELAARRSA